MLDAMIGKESSNNVYRRACMSTYANLCR